MPKDGLNTAGMDFEGKIDRLLELVMGLGNDINLINQRLDYIEKDQIRDLRETLKTTRDAFDRQIMKLEKTHAEYVAENKKTTEQDNKKINELEAWRNKILGVGGAVSFLLIGLQIYNIIVP